MPYWRRTLYTLWFTQFIAITGFSFVGPFIPYFIESLGVTEINAVALWSGLCGSATSIAAAIMAPVWGTLADRYGRKLMVLRATLIGALVMAAMGFVISVEQLVALRFLQGIFTGTIAASTSLVAGAVPMERRGAALGSLQTAVYLGTTLGPLLGGVIGDAFGYRPSFWITGGLLLLSGLLVLILVREHFHPASDTLSRRRPGFRQSYSFLLAGGAMLLALLAARILLRAGLMIPSTTMALFVQTLMPEGQHAALFTGIISGSMAIGGALGAPLIGAWGDRFGYKRMLLLSGLLGIVTFVPQALAPTANWLIVLQFFSGFAEGGILAITMALLAGMATGGREGTVFGLDASATAIASAIGPLVGAGVAAGLGLRSPFIVAAAVLGLGVVVVLRRVPMPAAEHAPGGLQWPRWRGTLLWLPSWAHDHQPVTSALFNALRHRPKASPPDEQPSDAGEPPPGGSRP
jgi:MFS transporter, DHA1 family, multidrug resistance protein